MNNKLSRNSGKKKVGPKYWVKSRPDLTSDKQITWIVDLCRDMVIVANLFFVGMCTCSSQHENVEIQALGPCY